MIEVYKDWVIAIDSRQYITGKRYRDKKGNVSMTTRDILGRSHRLLRILLRGSARRGYRIRI